MELFFQPRHILEYLVINAIVAFANLYSRPPPPTTLPLSAIALAKAGSFFSTSCCINSGLWDYSQLIVIVGTVMAMMGMIAMIFIISLDFLKVA